MPLPIRFDFIKDVVALDKYKVRVTYKRPTFLGLERFSQFFPIYPKKYRESVGDVAFGKKPVGTGPYKVEEFQPGRRVVLVRNPNYFDAPFGKPAIGKVVVKMIIDAQTEITELLGGNVDLAWRLNQEQSERLAKDPRLAVVSGDTNYMFFLQFDAANRSGKAEVLKDIRVRQAIYHAINRSALAKSVVGGNAVAINAHCHPRQNFCPANLPTHDYNPAKFRQLLKEAGITGELRIPLYVEIREKRIAEAVLGDLRAVGIIAMLQPLTVTEQFNRTAQGELPMSLWGWSSGSLFDAGAAAGFFLNGGPFDYARDAAINAQWDTANNTSDKKVRSTALNALIARNALQVYTAPLNKQFHQLHIRARARFQTASRRAAVLIPAKVEALSPEWRWSFSTIRHVRGHCRTATTSGRCSTPVRPRGPALAVALPRPPYDAVAPTARPRSAARHRRAMDKG